MPNPITNSSKYVRSNELFREAQNLVAGGVSSQIRRAESPVPLFFKRGRGSKLWDVDGNEYVDYVQGMGPNIFGHAPDFIIEAVTRDMAEGFCFAGQSELELTVTKLVRDAVPLGGLVRYASSGTEIDQLVIRLARGFTKRHKYVKFEGHYHGWTDSVLFSVHPPLEEAGPLANPTPVGESAGIDPSSADNLIVLPWNDLEALDLVFRNQGEHIAGVIMEPIMANTNCIIPRSGYLEGAATLCSKYGSLLIFDEVITGFRAALGGAQEVTGVVPDLATYGKAIAGGFPLSAIVGRADVMELLADGTVYHGGSFNSNVMVMSAARATLEHLSADPEDFYNDLNGMGLTLMEGLQEIASDSDVEMLVQGIGSTFWTTFTDRHVINNYREHAEFTDPNMYATFAEKMLYHGVRLATNGRWHMTSAHTSVDIEKTFDAAKHAFQEMSK